MKRTIAALSLFVFSACSSTGVVNYERDKVLATANDEDQPDWANENVPFQVKDGKVFSVGVAYIRGDEVPSAGGRIAANNARVNIAKAVENRMEFVFQQGAENASFDGQVAKFIGSEVSSLTANNLREEGHWWTRYATSEENGERRIKYRLYSLVTMSEADFKAAVYKAVNKATAQNKVSPEFRAQLARQWDRFVEGKGAAASSPAEVVADAPVAIDRSAASAEGEE
jgi:hypothetical protein